MKSATLTPASWSSTLGGYKSESPPIDKTDEQT